MTAILAPFDLMPDLAERAAAAIRAAAPELATVQTRAGALAAAELKDLGARAPAVVVSWLEARPARERAGPAPSFDLGMAAYVLAKDALGLPRETVAAAIAARIMALVPSRTWGRAEAGEAHTVRLQSLATQAVRNQGVALWAVTWLQPITFADEGELGEMPRTVFAPVDPRGPGAPYETVSEVPR